MKVAIYVINEGQVTQCYGLRFAEQDGALVLAPKWKTRKGAINYCKKHDMVCVNG